MNALISVRNLAKTYISEGAETPALGGVSFSIAPGEFAAIMGPSGSGKSTLLHMLGFLDRQTSGEYFFEGKSIAEYSDEDLARVRNEKIGFIFQAFNLLARTSVYNNVRLPLLYSRVPEVQWDRMVRDAIALVGLEHRMLHEPSQLSGGEKQRVAIARALVTNPEVIFADEPTGNLDSHSGNVIMETLDRLNSDKGHTIVLITHESFAAAHARRIITLRDGKVESDVETAGALQRDGLK